MHVSQCARLLACGAILAAACGSREPERRTAAPEATAPAEPAASRPRVVCLGDSLTAGHGLANPERAYPALLQARLRNAGFDWEVVNAGVSGDTSAAGLRRLEWSLQGDVRVLIVALGANDGLRGLPVTDMRRNLEAIAQGARARGITVILAGMEVPPNVGPAYTREFRAAFAELAARDQLAFVPFLLDGVAGVSALNQADGIHPNEEGQRRVADLLWPTLEPIVRAKSTS
jgi:acyl-CoA thioesterase I